MRIRRPAAAAAGAGRRPSGTSGQIRPSMCQSSGCSRDRGGERVGDRCIAAVTRSSSRPGPSTGTSGWNDEPPARARSNWQTAGMSAAPVCAASSAGPPGIVAGRPKKSTGTPPRAEVAVDEQAGRPAVAEPLAQHLGAGPRPAGERHDPHAQGLAVVEEPPVQRLRLEPLGDGHERAAEPVDEPDAGGVPVAAVRQGHDDARGPRRGPARRCSRPTISVPATIRSRAQRRQPEGLLPVPGVGAHGRGG